MFSSFLPSSMITQVDLRRMQPDMSLVGNFYGGNCGRLWDGYQFAAPDTNSTVAHLSAFDGLRGEGFTVPALFGYNEYYVLNETMDVVEEPLYGGMAQTVSQPVLVWCGQIWSITSHIIKSITSKSRDARFTFRATPTNLQEIIARFLSPNLITVFAPVPAFIFNFLPLAVRGPYVATLGNGHLISRKTYLRQEFAFLNSFSRECWTGIGVTLVGLSLATCALGRGPGERWLTKKYVSIFMSYCGLMLGESDRGLLKFNRILVGLWLLGATVVGSCMSGSMRELMSQALQVMAPQEWDDLWRYPFTNTTLLAVAFLPSWPAFVERYGQARVQQMEETGRLRLLLGAKLDAQSIHDIINPWDFVKGLIEIYIEMINLGKWIILIPKRGYFMALWGVKICHLALTQLYASLLFNDDMQVATEFFDGLMSDMYQHFAVSRRQGSWQWYYPFVRQCPPSIIDYFSGWMNIVAASGFLYLGNEMADKVLQDKFLDSKPMDSTCQELRVTDLTGPACMTVGFWVLSLLVLLMEIVFASVFTEKTTKARRLKRLKSRSNLFVKSPRRPRTTGIQQSVLSSIEEPVQDQMDHNGENEIKMQESSH